jgi:hypothetical protein
MEVPNWLHPQTDIALANLDMLRIDKDEENSIKFKVDKLLPTLKVVRSDKPDANEQESKREDELAV